MLLNKELGLTQNSYYEASVTRPVEQKTLDQHIQADVCVVGGGFAGLSCALELSLKGYSVVILEAKKVGWGASGRNGGQTLVGYANEDIFHEQLSASEAKTAWDISLEGIHLIRNRIKEYNIECDFIPGYMSLAMGERKAKALDSWVNKVAQQYNHHVDLIPHSNIHNVVQSDRFYSGASDPICGHLHPLKYCLALSRLAQQHSAKLFENTPVLNIDKGKKPLVKTKNGSVSCDFVVLAGSVYLNEYSDNLAPEIGAKIMPVGTYMVATQPMSEQRANALIYQRRAVCDTNFILDYFRLTADHRLLYGGGVSYTTNTPRNLTNVIQKRMLKVFPQLSDLKIDYTWGGFIDITMNRGPDFGRISDNIYYLQGFSGQGVALSGMSGKLAADAIRGHAEHFDLLSKLKHHPFPGGKLLRTPNLVLGTLFYRIKDML